MTTKRKAKAVATKPASGDAISSETPGGRARLATIPEVSAASVIEVFTVLGKQDVSDLAGELRKSGDAVVKGDTASIERMLMAQAHALDSLFATLSRRAGAQTLLAQFETHLKLALRAQSQCRATLETLAEIKNPPPIAFVRQANITNGPQQINNGEAAPFARAEQTENQPTELLRLTHDNRKSLGFETTATAVPSNPPLEAVAAVHGTKDA